MGVLGLLADPEASMVDVDPCCCQELGRAGVPGPVVEHAAVVVPALGALDGYAGLLDGSLVATAAGFDGSPYIAHAQVASLILTPAGVRAGFTATDVDGIDGGRRLFSVSGGPTPRSPELDANAAFDRARWRWLPT